MAKVFMQTKDNLAFSIAISSPRALASYDVVLNSMKVLHEASGEIARFENNS
jgi:hypothetical protein